jgi:hypothetical protein
MSTFTSKISKNFTLATVYEQRHYENRIKLRYASLQNYLSEDRKLSSHEILFSKYWTLRGYRPSETFDKRLESFLLLYPLFLLIKYVKYSTQI